MCFFRRTVVLVDCHNKKKDKNKSLFIEIFLLYSVKLLLGLYIDRQNTGLSDFNNELENVISQTFMRSSLIFVGDYNINLFNHEIHTETGNFVCVLVSKIIHLVMKPIRYGEHSATLIDNILTQFWNL